jgi:hypothetical protein
MIENPYQPPQLSVRETDRTVIASGESAARRAAALFYVRLILGLLTLPAIYNVICFSYPGQAISPIPVGMRNTFFLGNLVALIAFVSIIYFAGLWFFEVLTRGSHAIFSRRPTLTLWLDALYATFIRSAPYAVAGSVLWAIWVYGFYQTNVDFLLLSVPVGILAHTLAAALYLPLIYRWYRIEIKGVRPL